MSEPSISSVRELVQADIQLSQGTVEIERAVLIAVQGRDGVESIYVAEGLARVCYDPVKITHVELETLITQAEGAPPQEFDMHRTSPLADLEVPAPEPYFPTDEAGRID